MILIKELILWLRLKLQKTGIKSGAKEKNIQIGQALISRFRLLKSPLCMIAHKIQQFQIIKEEKESISEQYRQQRLNALFQVMRELNGK